MSMEQRDAEGYQPEEQEGVTPEVSREQTPREAGRARIEGAGRWIKAMIQGAGEKVSKGWGFMKKMGGKAVEGTVAAAEHIMGTPEHAVNAAKATAEFAVNDWNKTGEHVQAGKEAIVGGAQAVGEFLQNDAQQTSEHFQAGVEAVRDGYQFVSEGIRSDAAETWADMQESYGKVIEIKDAGMEWGRQKIDQIVDAGTRTREGLVGKLHNWQTQREANRILKQREQQIAMAEKQVRQLVQNNERAQAMGERGRFLLEQSSAIYEANNQAIDEIKQQLAQLRGNGTEQGA